MMRVAVVIPAFDAERTVAAAVQSMRQVFPHARVIVVDDGSSDETSQRARDCGAVVVSHDRRRGVGAALKTAFAVALREPCDVFVTIGADLQRDPQDACLLVKQLVEKGEDLVIGSKFLKRENVIPFVRSLSGRSLSLFVRWLFGIEATDVVSGFRAIRAVSLRDYADLPDGYAFDCLFLVHMVKRGKKFSEIPVTVHYHSESTRMKYPLLEFLSIVRHLMSASLLKGK